MRFVGLRLAGVFGQGKIKRRSLALLGLGPNTAAMAENNALNVGEANAGAFEFIVVVQSLENTKQFVRVLHIETDSIITHKNDVFLSVRARADFDARRLRRYRHSGFDQTPMRNGRAPCDGILCSIEGYFMASPERITVCSTGMREKGDDYSVARSLAQRAKSLSGSPHCRFTFLVHSYLLGQVEAERKPAVRSTDYQGYEFISR